MLQNANSHAHLCEIGIEFKLLFKSLCSLFQSTSPIINSLSFFKTISQIFHLSSYGIEQGRLTFAD